MRSPRRHLFLAVLLAAATLVAVAKPKVRAPQEYLGFAIGDDRKLADYNQMLGYFREVDTVSDRLTLQELGTTTEGNPFVMAIITAPENHAKLSGILQTQAKLADPRGRDEEEINALVEQAKAVVLINCSIHADEVGAAQMSLLLAHYLCSQSTPAVRKILEEVVCLLVPAHNPDGQLKITDWYRKNLGSRFETAPMPWLYQKYCGHDLNRDWFMFTQKETQLTVEKIHQIYRPHITVDMHEMGKSGARFFVPPYVDPVEPNVDPILVGLLGTLGNYVAATLTAEGKAGVVNNAIFDGWTPARAYPHYHGGIRFLTEAAGVDIASPVTIAKEKLRGGVNYDATRASVNFPKPWAGGTWRLRDIIDYDFSAALAVLQHAAANREFWVRSCWRVQQNAINRDTPPRAFVVPAEQTDSDALDDLLETLHFGGVEIHQMEEDFVADGTSFKKKDFVIWAAQPYGPFAKAMLEKTQYPHIKMSDGTLRRPYDVTAHHLPSYLGVRVWPIENKFEVAAHRLEKIDRAEGYVAISPSGWYILPHATQSTFTALNLLMRRGVKCFWLLRTVAQEHAGFVIEATRHLAVLHETAQTTGARFEAFVAPLKGTDFNAPTPGLYEIHLPRLGVYQSWVAAIDEGWTRWVLEQCGFDFVLVHDAEVRAGNLRRRFDAIVLPDQAPAQIIDGHSPEAMPAPYAGGLGDRGVQALKEFVERGGTLVTFNRACALAIEKFSLPVRNILAEVALEKFDAPGTVLQVLADTSHPLAHGAQREEAILFFESPAFCLQGGKAILSYPEKEVVISGWLQASPSAGLTGHHALVEVSYGEGRVILFGFRPQFRGQFRASYKFFFNAIFYAAAEPLSAWPGTVSQ